MGKTPKVLVITGDCGMITGLAERRSQEVEIGFARNGYEASAILCDFRPTFVLVDEDLLLASEPGLTDYLGCDSRVQGVKLVLAARDPVPEIWRGNRHTHIAAIITKPVKIEMIEALARDWAVERISQEKLAETADLSAGVN